MGKNFWFNGVLAGMLLLFSACAGNEYQLLTQDSPTSKENTLVVIGVKWIETYNDTKDKEEKTSVSFDLLMDEALIKDKRVEKDKTALYLPLYYMHTFRFELTDQNGEDHSFVRFGKDLLQYEKIALYQFKPGTYTLKGIEMAQNRFEEANAKNSPVRWQRFKVDHQENFGTWELPPGKIVYLGGLILHFKTKRFIFGIFTPEELIESIKLEKVEFKNDFEAVKSDLMEQKPWFPADQIINLATDQEWVYVHVPQPSSVDTESEQPKQKDKNAFF